MKNYPIYALLFCMTLAATIPASYAGIFLIGKGQLLLAYLVGTATGASIAALIVASKLSGIKDALEALGVLADASIANISVLQGKMEDLTPSLSLRIAAMIEERRQRTFDKKAESDFKLYSLETAARTEILLRRLAKQTDDLMCHSVDDLGFCRICKTAGDRHKPDCPYPSAYRSLMEFTSLRGHLERNKRLSKRKTNDSTNDQGGCDTA